MEINVCFRKNTLLDVHVILQDIGTGIRLLYGGKGSLPKKHLSACDGQCLNCLEMNP